MRDEGFYLFASRIAKRLDAAEIRSVGLDQVGIEFVLADELAKAVANLRAAVIAIAIGRLRRKLLRVSGGLWRLGEGPDLLNRTDADAVGFAESAVDGTRLGDSHLSALDEVRDIGGIGITVTNEPATASRSVDSSSERIASICLIAQLTNWLDLHSRAVATLGQTDQTSVGHVPTTTEKTEVAAL